MLHLNSDTNLGTSLGCSTSRAAHNIIPKRAKGRDAEGAKDAGVRGARVVPCVVVLGDTPAIVVGG